MIIKRFSVLGLHGYKDIGITFDSKARIVVAENGSGKTTILNALHSLLTSRFKRLNSVDFDSIECEFVSGQTVSLKKSSLSLESGEGEELADRLHLSSGVPAEEILRLARSDIDLSDTAASRAQPIFRRIVMQSPFSFEDVEQRITQIRKSISDDEKSVGEVKSLIADQMTGIEVVFLPTYRRVELPLLRSPRRPGERPASERYARGTGSTDPRLRGLNFGLADVEARLAELADEVERKSNTEYRLVSARIVNQLLNQLLSSADATKNPLPSLDAIELFFSRVGISKQQGANMDSLRKFYELPQERQGENVFLRYFLGQLSQVIDQTKVIEEMLRQFVDACNQYLQIASDEKQLAYDQESMKVVVKNLWSGSDVPLDALSSGEKQMISLMAKLSLDSTRKLVLIDEPELSLSLDWQKKILVDVMKTESVTQFLAITHSPFVFDNELAEHAAPLSIVRRRGESQ